MSDPYKVLGISSSASDDEVKDAYRKLARKYHPDNYVNNPLSDLATEKMKEINEAYDEVQRQRKNGGSTSSGYGGQSYGGGYGNPYGGYRQQQSYSSSGSSQFADIRRLINGGRIADAEELLDGVAQASRTAEWNFLKGTVNYQKGWLDNAVTYYGKACSLEPNNMEYRAAYSRLMQQRQNGYGGSMMGSSICDVCTSLYCGSLCCNCMGGGGGC